MTGVARAEASSAMCVSNMQNIRSPLLTREDNISDEVIQTADPRAAYFALKAEIDAAITDTLAQPHYSLGPIVERFEAAFARYCGVRHGVGVNSGTDAIHLALRGLGIGQDDEVITVSHTSVATVAAIEMSGARPVLVEVDRLFWTIDPGAVIAAITPRTKAVVAVHLYGQSVDIARLADICTQYRLALIEDCAQAHGAFWDGKPLGSFGVASCFSFYPSKNLGTIGDAGMILTNESALAEKLRMLRQYGWDRPQNSVMPGWNSRLGPLQAAILRVKLQYLDRMIDRRIALAESYSSALSDLPLTLPRKRNLCRHSFHLFVVRTQQSSERDRLKSHLSDRGVAAGIHYAAPVHLQPAYANRVKLTDLRFTENLASTILSLPLYPEMADDQQQRVIGAIRQFFTELT
jgi:dTDP-4-amino-4,6-dideoxygalactose transaminase